MSEGFEVLVQLVMAAMTTAPPRKVKRVAVVSDGNFLDRRSFHDFRERSLGLAQRDAILRTLGTSDWWPQRFPDPTPGVSLKSGGGVLSVSKEAFALCSRLRQERSVFRRARCELQISECFRINGEEAHGRAILGGHVGNGGAVRNAQGRQTPNP